MKWLVEFPLDSGGSVFIKVDEKTPVMMPASSLGDKIIRATKTFEAFDTLQLVAGRIVGKLRDLAAVWICVSIQCCSELS
jgi:hypothetical protein